ncbi:MAG TPA: ABC transporter permease [Thermomicrobiales bacterium]|nr:ABC transporter permease [Thermomicrobiales bacterium]
MLDFRRIRLVALREWTTRLRQRSFQITTALQILFVLIIACLPTIVGVISGDDENQATTLLVIDDANASIVDRLQPYVTAGDGVEPIDVHTGDGTLDDARAQVEDGAVDNALVVTRGDDQQIAFTFLNKDGKTTATSQRIYAAATTISLEDRLQQSGVPAEDVQQAIAPPSFAVQPATNVAPADNQADTEPTGPEYVISYVATLLMFMAIVLYGTWIAQGVVEEKSSRIMEIMVNAATPRDLLAGKVIGIGMAALTQLIPMLLVGGIAFALQGRIAEAFGVTNESILDVEFGALTVRSIGVFLVYFLIGFVLYGSLYAGIGSLVSRQEEVNQAVAPMMTVVMVGYFGAFYTLAQPDSVIAKVLAIVPLTAPFTGVPRILLGHPAPWEIALSIGLLALTAIIGVLVAARLYRIGVLMYGQRPSWKSLLRMDTMQQVAR